MELQIPEGYIAVDEEKAETCVGCAFYHRGGIHCRHPQCEATGCMNPRKIFKKIEPDSKSESEN